MFHETIVNINEKEKNQQLILFFNYLIQSRHTQDIVSKYLDYISIALICSIPKEQDQIIQKLADAFVTLINNAELQGNLQ